MSFSKKCNACSPSGTRCTLEKCHDINTPHKDRKGIMWFGSWSHEGVVLVNAINKAKPFDDYLIILTPELSKLFGNIFDEVADELGYSYCDDCDSNGRDYYGPTPWNDLD